MKSLFLLLFLAACTTAQANQAIQIGGIACEVIVQVADPAVAPLCATAEEVAQAIAAIVEDASKAGAVKGALAPVFTPDAIRGRVLAARAKKGTP